MSRPDYLKTKRFSRDCETATLYLGIYSYRNILKKLSRHPVNIGVRKWCDERIISKFLVIALFLLCCFWKHKCKVLFPTESLYIYFFFFFYSNIFNLKIISDPIHEVDTVTITRGFTVFCINFYWQKHTWCFILATV